MPEVLVTGQGRLVRSPIGTLKEHQESVPLLHDFPFERPLYNAREKSSTDRIHQLLLRLLFAVPVGRLKITVIDPVEMGRSLAPFLPLTDTKEIVPNQKFLTISDEIESALKKLHDDSEELTQKRFQGGIGNWKNYNVLNPDKKLPYHLLFIFDFPEQCTDRSILYLKRLITFGSECGILPIVTVDHAKISALYDKHPAREIEQLLNEKGESVRELFVPKYGR
jgi:hypothetical protein